MVLIENLDGIIISNTTFLQEDLETLFLNTEYKKIPGKTPEIIFYNKNNEEIERIDISSMLRLELVELLDKKGIPRNPAQIKSADVDEKLKKKVLTVLKEHEAKEALNEL